MMNSMIDTQDLSLDSSVEKIIENELREYLRQVGQTNLDANVQQLLATEDGGFVDRFNYFMPLIDEKAKENMLVSGCAMGGECYLARKAGFRSVVGTEVGFKYVEMANRRFHHLKGMQFFHYDGRKLPFEANTFSMINSGHIIEHTGDPRWYFLEHFRVLRPGGFFFLEFPDRHHPVELHTNTTSFEWLPLALRNVALRFMASKWNRFDKERRHLYDLVRQTLVPVGIKQIQSFLRGRGVIVHHYQPAKGYVRMVIRKNGN